MKMKVCIVAVIIMVLVGCRKDTKDKQKEFTPYGEASVCEAGQAGQASELPRLPLPLGFSCAVRYGNSIYVFGGVTVSDDPLTPERDHFQFPKPSPLVLIYDLTSESGKQGVWRYGAPMPIPVAGASCAAFNGGVWVLGGYADGQTKDNPAGRHRSTPLVQIYEPDVDKWYSAHNMMESRTWSALTIVGNDLCMVGGVGAGRYHNSIECYDITRDVWSAAGELQNRRYGLGAIEKDHKIFVYGGDEFHDQGHTDYDLVEVVDPFTAGHKVLGKMDKPRTTFVSIPWTMYLYWNGEVLDARDPPYLRKVVSMPITAEELDKTYQGWGYPSVVKLNYAFVFIGGGNSAAPTDRVMAVCSDTK